MDKNMQTYSTIVGLLIASEERAANYCEELHAVSIELSSLDDEIEQSMYDNSLLTNIINRISNRIATARGVYSSPEIALDEIEDIIEESK